MPGPIGSSPSPVLTPAAPPPAAGASPAGAPRSGRLDGGLEVRVQPSGAHALASEAARPAPRAQPPRTEGVKVLSKPGSSKALAAEAVPSASDFIRKIGRAPRGDINIPIIGRKRDTAYKEVLAALDGYHKALGNTGKGQHARTLEGLSPAREQQVKDGLDLCEALERVEGALDRFSREAGKSSPEVAFRLKEVRQELGMLHGALDQLAAHGDESLTLQDVVGLRHFQPDLTLDQVTALKAAGHTHQGLAGLESRSKPHLTRQDIAEGLKEGLSPKAFAEVPGLRKLHPELSGVEVRRLAAAGHSPPGLQKLALNTEGHLTKQDMANGLKLGLSPKDMEVYQRARMPITPATVRIAVRDPSAPELRRLGSGGVNTVYRGDVRLLDGTVIDGVYKKQAHGAAWDFNENPPKLALVGAAEKMRISVDQPNWGARSVATYKLDQRLGLGITPRTELIRNGDELGFVMAHAPGRSPLFEGEVRVAVQARHLQRLLDEPDVMQHYAQANGFAGARLDGDTLVFEPVSRSLKGTVPYADADGKLSYREETTVSERGNILATDYNKGDLRKEMTRMQWFDALTGQTDRHGHNYFVDRGADGRVKLTLIDNDMAFGSRPFNLKTDNYQLPPLPKVIDRPTREALLNLTPEQVAEDCAALQPEEIKQAQNRLAAIKAHLASLPGDAILENDAGWETTLTAERLGMTSEANSTWSYVAREAVLERSGDLGRVNLAEIEAKIRGDSEPGRAAT